MLALPTLVYVVAFFLIPLVAVVVYSFASISLLTFDVTFDWNLDNYRAIRDPLYLNTLVRSVLLSVGATFSCLLIGFPVAYFISRQPGRWQHGLLALIIIPFWASSIVRTYAMVNLLSGYGPLDQILVALRLVSGSLSVLYTPQAIGIGIVYTYLPLMVLPIYVALERIDPQLLTAASDLGSNSWRVFRRVTFPLAIPGVAVGCVIVGIPAMGEYVIPEILGGGKTLMLGNVISEQFIGAGNIPFGSAIAVVLMLVMGLVLLTTRRYTRMKIL